MAHIRDILLLDESGEGDHALADFLTQRGLRLLPVNTVRTALAALQRGRETGAPFDMVIGYIKHLATDGMLFLRDLQRWQDPIPVVLIADYGSINPQVATDIQAMGVLTIIDMPVDLAQVAEILAQQENAPPPAAAPATSAAISSMQFQPADLPPQAILQDSLMPVRVMVNRHQATSPVTNTGTLRQRRSVDAPVTGSTVRFPQQPPQPRFPTPMPGQLGVAPQPMQPRNPTPPPQPRNPTPQPRNPTPQPQLPPQPRAPAPLPIPQLPPQPRYPTPLPIPQLPPRPQQPQQAQQPPVARPLPAPAPLIPGSSRVRSVTCGACQTVINVERKPMAYVTVCVHCGSMLRIEPG